MAAALVDGQRDEFKRLLTEAPEPIDSKQLFAVIVENEKGERDVVVVASQGDDLRPDTMITPEHKTDFLNAVFEA